ncbi:MAG: hypothetical protein KA165_07255 [Saprospiraceae bacterium]|nr:hypothetical protein [Saprospiraceae bacterium]
MAKLKVAELKKYLDALSETELRAEVLKLFSKLKQVQDFYGQELSSEEDRNKILEEYKARIRKQFYSPRSGNPQNPKASKLRAIVSEFEKISIFPHELIDLALYRVELGVQFTNDYGDMNEAFYRSVATAFERALKMIVAHKLEDHFEFRCQAIVRNTDDIGWGFGEEMDYLYSEYIGGR